VLEFALTVHQHIDAGFISGIVRPIKGKAPNAE